MHLMCTECPRLLKCNWINDRPLGFLGDSRVGMRYLPTTLQIPVDTFKYLLFAGLLILANSSVMSNDIWTIFATRTFVHHSKITVVGAAMTATPSQPSISTKLLSHDVKRNQITPAFSAHEESADVCKVKVGCYFFQ